MNTTERETWYILEDGSAGSPAEVATDAKGVLRHKDGRAVAMRGDVPRSRSVDPAAERAKEKPAPKPAPKPASTPKAKDMKPEEPAAGYKTRETKAD